MKKEDVKAVIDYSNIEIKELLDKCFPDNLPEVNHWIDQYYKIMISNLEKIKE